MFSPDTSLADPVISQLDAAPVDEVELRDGDVLASRDARRGLGLPWSEAPTELDLDLASDAGSSLDV